jgi:hypothetical protein
VIRRLAIAGGIIALAVTLAGCEPTAPIATPSPSAIVGTWHHGSDYLDLNADGTFALKDIPLGVVEQDAVKAGGTPSGPNESVSGTWAIGSGGTDAGGAPGVQLTFLEPKKVGPNYGLTLIVSGDTPPRLYLFLGRSDSNIRYEFTRS